MSITEAFNSTRTVPGFSLLERQYPPFTMVQPKPEPAKKWVAPWLREGNEPYVKDAQESQAAPARPAISAAERHRLVEAAKSPTPIKPPKNPAVQAHCDLYDWVREKGGDWSQFWKPGRVVELDQAPAVDIDHFFETGEITPAARVHEAVSTHEVSGLDTAKTSAWAVVAKRDWSNEYRIRTQVDQPHALPPEQAGARVTTSLTDNGARKIADSCAFMHLKRGGFRTFVTLTLDSAGRSRVEIRQASGPFVELDDKLKAKGITAKAADRCRGLWLGGEHRESESREEWRSRRNEVRPQSPIKYLSTSPDGPYCPVEFTEGASVAAATGEADDDVTYSTVQKEVSRFFDAAHKMRQRGWVAEKTYPWGKVKCFEREGVQVGEEPSPIIGIKGFLADRKITLKRRGVRYCWVVENPLRKPEKRYPWGNVTCYARQGEPLDLKGQRNPHIHILMDWRVKFSAFASWADRLESLWGQGFAHIEKIKDSELAGAYMAKAAGYLSKSAEGDDQGPVRGNRYGIAADARAPDWCCIGRYPINVMGHLITDVHDYFTHCYGAQFKARRELKEKLDATPKQAKGVRKRIGRALAKVREQLNSLPAIASKYQLIIRGEERVKEFFAWATSNKSQYDGKWLPAKNAADRWDPMADSPPSHWYQEFQFRLHARKAARRFSGLAVSLYERWIKQEPHARRDPESPPPWWSTWREWEGITA